MQSLGRQLIVELYGCDTTLLDDPSRLEIVLTEAIHRSGATIIRPFFHQFSPHGVSGVIVIAESHVAIHTWPEYGYGAVDIFTCGDQVRLDFIFDHIRTELRAQNVSVMEVQRGTLQLAPAEMRHKPSESSCPSA
ncbi:MAG: adenosylmethionine decarboxylase [bacterium]